MAKNLKFSRYLRKSKNTPTAIRNYIQLKLQLLRILKIRITIKSQKEVPNAIIMVTEEVVLIRKRLVILKKNLR